MLSRSAQQERGFLGLASLGAVVGEHFRLAFGDFGELAFEGFGETGKTNALGVIRCVAGDTSSPLQESTWSRRLRCSLHFGDGSFATGRGKLQIQQCPQCAVSDGRPEKGGLSLSAQEETLLPRLAFRQEEKLTPRSPRQIAAKSSRQIFVIASA
jgi:hypothetical protein